MTNLVGPLQAFISIPIPIYTITIYGPLGDTGAGNYDGGDKNDEAWDAAEQNVKFAKCSV